MTKTVGEHWVAAQLARLGWAPALTRDGLERTDILAVNTMLDRKQIEVQVKTVNGTGPRTSWPLGEKAQQVELHDREWFVLVAVPHEVTEPPRSFVIPRNHVAAAAWIAHMHWLTEPGVPAGRRNAGVGRARVFIEAFLRYENRWDLLHEPTTAVPVLLPPRMRKQASRPEVGLPLGHPWTGSLPEW